MKPKRENGKVVRTPKKNHRPLKQSHKKVRVRQRTPKKVRRRTAKKVRKQENKIYIEGGGVDEDNVVKDNITEQIIQDLRELRDADVYNNGVFTTSNVKNIIKEIIDNLKMVNAETIYFENGNIPTAHSLRKIYLLITQGVATLAGEADIEGMRDDTMHPTYKDDMLLILNGRDTYTNTKIPIDFIIEFIKQCLVDAKFGVHNRSGEMNKMIKSLRSALSPSRAREGGTIKPTPPAIASQGLSPHSKSMERARKARHKHDLREETEAHPPVLPLEQATPRGGQRKHWDVDTGRGFRTVVDRNLTPRKK
jgi:hypothetical protein|tara:strand:+ start:228 stop:1151 length:924 start_codon:yes stop_codon:yes gene_type:complete